MQIYLREPGERPRHRRRRLWYDYNRDGWVIEQASTFQWADDDKVLDHDWREVALREILSPGIPPFGSFFLEPATGSTPVARPGLNV